LQILIIGAGAMGSLFATLLVQGGQEVALYDMDQQKVDAINQKGITVTSPEKEGVRTVVSAVSTIEEALPAELVIFMVKSYQTDRAVREASVLFNKNTKVLTLQNGLGNIEKIAKLIDSKQVYVGVTYYSAKELEAAKIAHTGMGMTLIAPMEKDQLPAAMDLARMLNNCGIEAGATNDLDAIIWKKLIVNSVINPLTAIHGLNNGELVNNPEVVRDMADLVIEGVAVAQKMGIPLNYGEIWASVLETCRLTAQNRSSMLTDVEGGRHTEIDAINGSIVRLGEANGVDTPVNTRMMRGVLALDKGRASNQNLFAPKI